MQKRRKRWTCFLWGVSYKGELITSLIMSYSKDEIKRAATNKSNSRSYQQARARGWKVVRVRRTESIEEE